MVQYLRAYSILDVVAIKCVCRVILDLLVRDKDEGSAHP